MNSMARYQAFASMEETAREVAKSDEEYVFHDARYAAYSTAARHAMLADRWAMTAAADRAAAARARAADQAEMEERAERSAAIAVNHRDAAQALADAVAEIRSAVGAAPDAPPTVVDIPYVGGDGAVGGTLTCTMGNWTGEPTSYAYRWQRDGADVASSTPAYVVDTADAGHSIACVVTATNMRGSTTAPPSNAVAIPANGATRRAR
jgi:hypothetical protein